VAASFLTGGSAGAGAISSAITYRGSRYSFGYPACPDLAMQKVLFDILEPGEIGLELTETFEMTPEQSTTAIIIHHPGAKYFAV
jgi:5-methyltetrahydrofolate--homocysteine methyltransferase